MYDYSNLSPMEFETLCADIMSREINVDLRYFSPGRDGGIDLTDSPSKRNVVVQVKHYLKTDFSGLKSSLEKELVKLKEMSPKPGDYYICTSKDLTNENIKKIYELFKDFMSSDKNIFTKYEIDTALSKESNQDILRKNFKLWLVADQVLTQLINRETFIDGEVLLDNLELDFKYFVPTNLFNQSIEVLKKYRKTLICGDPGVGKSITSKMLTFYFVKMGYKIRYTTNGIISDLKKSLHDSKHTKEVILLDDCLGQYYLKLKEWQDEELISLMNYINLSENKILILNSRITVLNEAQNISGKLRRYLDDDKVKIKTINMNDITKSEKALIFLNHLVRNEVPNEYYNSIRFNKRYSSIISHKNYNPRIIEYVTHKRRYTLVKPEAYYNFIIDTLNNPTEVWREEFSQGLSIEDRIFMHTLFSLTDTFIDIEILEECFVKRIQTERMIDPTTNKFEESKERLTQSLIKVVEVNGRLKIGTLNPSLNDFMSNAIERNHLEKEKIISNSVYLEQINKILKNQTYSAINKLISNKQILTMKSLGNNRDSYILAYIYNNRLFEPDYIDHIETGLEKMNRVFNFGDVSINKLDLIKFLLGDREIYEFYKINEKIDSEYFIDCLIKYLNLDEIIIILNEIRDLEEQEVIEVSYITEYIFETYIELVKDYIDDLEYEDIVEDSNLYVLEDYKKYGNDEGYKKEFNLIRTKVIKIFEDEILMLLKELKDFNETHNQMLFKDISGKIQNKVDNELEEVLESYMDLDPFDFYEDRREREFEKSMDEIDLILDRNLE